MPDVRAFHCIWALLLLTASSAAAQVTPTVGYTIFVRGTPVGREDVTVDATLTSTTIVSTGRLSAPLNVTLRRGEFRYRSDWTPESLFVDWSANGADATLRTTFTDGEATSSIMQQGKASMATAKVAPRTIMLPNNVFAAYVAVARRLVGATPGDRFTAYVVPASEVEITVTGVAAERVQIGSTFLDVRRHELTIANPTGPLTVNLTSDGRGALIRVALPAAEVDVVREDLAASTSRLQLYSNAGDEPVIIPAVGFNLGATITRPKTAASRLPAVILIGGSGVSDRDGFVAGIPTLGQLAGAVADAGFLAVRYDKRGFGQSGGRSESATLQDYSDDVRAVVRWLRSRKDVDPDRIAVVGHSEGGWVALQAAAREDRIDAVVALATPATTGAELVLAQQQTALDRLKLEPGEREKRVELQKQIQNAVMTGKGWASIPEPLRRDADTPWFQSLLAFDPSKVVDDVRQPVLFVHGELDRQVPVAHVTTIADIAREGRSRAVEVVTVRGVNHLLVPAVTGEVAEYATLTDRNVSADVRTAVTTWLTKTFAAIR